MSPKPIHRPNEDEDRKLVEGHPPQGPIGHEPDGVQRDIAQADEAARRKSGDYQDVRDTPPSGDYDDTMPE